MATTTHARPGVAASALAGGGGGCSARPAARPRYHPYAIDRGHFAFAKGSNRTGCVRIVFSYCSAYKPDPRRWLAHFTIGAADVLGITAEQAQDAAHAATFEAAVIVTRLLDEDMLETAKAAGALRNVIESRLNAVAAGFTVDACDCGADTDP